MIDTHDSAPSHPVDERGSHLAVHSSRGGVVGPAVALLAVWILIVLWQLGYHQEDARRHEQALERAGQASLRTLEAALRSVGRGRRQRPQFLATVFDGVFEIPEIRGAWLIDQDGRAVFSRGVPEGIDATTVAEETRWLDDGVVVGRPADIGSCPFDGEGRPRAADEQERPLFLFLFLERTEADRGIAADLRLRVTIVSVAAVAAIGVFLFLKLRGRARRLGTELVVIRERERRHREWALVGAGLAHETKNPLAVIRGIAQELASAGAGPSHECQRAIEIVDEVDTVVGRIDEFLRYSRPLEPKPGPLALRQLCEQMARLVEPDLSPRRGELSIEGQERTVLADRGMLRQILLNLLINAANAMDDGGHIRLVVRRDADGGVMLEVKDDGRGVSAEEIDKVFEPYYSRTPGGTGLGLAIVQRLVEAHGWHVELESEPGVETTIRISGMRRVTS